MASGSERVSAVYEILYDPNYTPRSSPDCHVENITIDGKPSLLLIKQAAADYYDVDPTTSAIWNLLDGRRTVQEIFQEAKKFDDSLTEKQVKDVLISLAEEGTLESTEQEVQSRRIEVPSPFEVDIHILKDSSKSLAGLFRVTRKLIRREELPIAIAVALLGFVLFYPNFLRIFANPSIFSFAGSTALGFLFYQIFVLLPVYAVHELAHAAVCDYYGGKPRGIGTGLYYLAPFFYCDVSDAWRLSRRARIMISLAGPLSTVVIASIMVLLSSLVPPGFLRNVLQISAFFGYYGTLINFSPVIETDGYYILAEVLNISNLRDEAFSFVKRTFLRALRRPVPVLHQSERRRRIIGIYSIITFAWLAFFGYATLWVLYVYGTASYAAVLGLGAAALGVVAFNLTAVAVNFGTLVYFGLYLSGFVVMGVVAFKNIRMKGVKLETIHDKRVSAFLPLPSFMQSSKSSNLVAEGRKVARKYCRSYSVTLEPPLCVAALKLGKVDQSLDAMRGEMQDVERAFRSFHRDFLSKNPVSMEASPAKKAMADYLVRLAGQFDRRERSQALSAASEFLRSQDNTVATLLESAFGTVWTLEVSPGDYKRIKREIFPGLVAEDLGLTEFSRELQDFKKHTVLGPEAIAQLSSEVEEESKEVYRNPEVYQTTAFIEPMKSRLIFVGRTDKVAGSVVWLGGLFLYQAWTRYVGGLLDDAALGLKSISLAPSVSPTKTQVRGMTNDELVLLGGDIERMEALAKTVEEAIPKIESTLESAKNFHETLTSLVQDETFDIGLYKPILNVNGKHLEGVEDKIKKFKDEFGKAYKKLTASAVEIREERDRRTAARTAEKQSRVRTVGQRVASLKWVSAGQTHTPTFDAQVRLHFAASRLVYGVVLSSDVIF